MTTCEAMRKLVREKILSLITTSYMYMASMSVDNLITVKGFTLIECPLSM